MQLKSYAWDLSAGLIVYFTESGNEYHNLRRITPAGVQKTLKRLVLRAYREGAKTLIQDDRALAVFPTYELIWQVV